MIVSAPPISWNEWHSLTPADEALTVSVIIPAKDNQGQLNLCLASLVEQDYPHDKFVVIVVDHGSLEPLVLPEWAPASFKMLRHDNGSGPGAPRAAGAKAASSDVLLFIDSDIIASSSMVRNFSRWHSVAESAVVLGFRDFIAPEGISVEDIRNAVKSDCLVDFMRDRKGTEGQEWIDAYLRSSADNTKNREDLWTIVVGAGLAIRRDFYEYIGGFRDFRVHGIEDTEFGFRAFTGGGIIIPDRECLGYHMGMRTISKNRDAVMRDRFSLLANTIAHDRARPPLKNSIWQVPKVQAQIVLGNDADFVAIRSTVDDILVSTFTDVHVEIFCSLDDLRTEIIDYYTANSRVSLSNGNPQSGFPAPFTLRVDAGVRFNKESLENIVSDSLADPQGVVAYVIDSDDVSLELWRTRTMCRASFAASVTNSQEARSYIRDNFGETWKPAASVGLTRDKGVSDFRLHGGRYVLGTGS